MKKLLILLTLLSCNTSEKKFVKDCDNEFPIVYEGSIDIKNSWIIVENDTLTGLITGNVGNMKICIPDSLMPILAGTGIVYQEGDSSYIDLLNNEIFHEESSNFKEIQLIDFQ